jgi:hypothetical protein
MKTAAKDREYFKRKEGFLAYLGRGCWDGDLGGFGWRAMVER